MAEAGRGQACSTHAILPCPHCPAFVESLPSCVGSLTLEDSLLDTVAGGSSHLTCMPLRVSVLANLDTLCKLAGSPGLLEVSQPCKAFRHRALGLINLRQDNPLRAVLGLSLPVGRSAWPCLT